MKPAVPKPGGMFGAVADPQDWDGWPVPVGLGFPAARADPARRTTASDAPAAARAIFVRMVYLGSGGRGTGWGRVPRLV